MQLKNKGNRTMYTDGFNKFNTLEELFSESSSCFSVMPEMLNFAIALTQKYGLPIGHGLTRVVWNTNKGHVFKVPRCDKGSLDNSWESSISIEQTEKHEEGYAKTKGFLVNDYLVCIAEYITSASNAELKEVFGKIPDWTYSIDCQQVGFDKKGFLKAYDFA